MDETKAREIFADEIGKHERVEKQVYENIKDKLSSIISSITHIRNRVDENKKEIESNSKNDGEKINKLEKRLAYYNGGIACLVAIGALGYFITP